MSRTVAGVVLAAGAGTRLRPLTLLRPKALCPVGGVPLVDLALDRLGRLVGVGPPNVAVNAHHLADQVVEHCRGRAHISVEQPEALGTAGALGQLRDWIDGRDVVVVNADTYLADDVDSAFAGLLDAWDGERCRLLCTPVGDGERVDFVDDDGRPARFAGVSVLPWRLVRELEAVPSGLYEVLWRRAAADHALDLVGTEGTVIDCGTPADYLRANVAAFRGQVGGVGAGSARSSGAMEPPAGSTPGRHPFGAAVERSALRLAGAGVWTYDPRTGQVAFDGGTAAALALPDHASGGTGSLSLLLSAVHVEDAASTVEALHRFDDGVLLREVRVRERTGVIRWVGLCAGPADAADAAGVGLAPVVGLVTRLDRENQIRERAGLVDRLERALERGRRLLEVTRGLQTALTPAGVATTVTAHAQRALGTYFAGIALADLESRTLSYVSMSPLPSSTAKTWASNPLDLSAPVTDAARQGKAFFHETVEQAVADFPDIGAHMREAGVGAMAHLPLVGSTGRTLGALALTFAEPHEMSPRERDFMITLAGHTSQALERALLFDQQRGVADALQRAVLPAELPDLPGWDMAARYVPATTGLEVGGDWYDAFLLPDGHLALAVGDATGHGLAAARVMSAVRNALRAYAVLGEGPAAVVERLDQMLTRLEPQALATVVYVELDPATGRGLLAAAGHPPPMLCRPGKVSFLDLDVDPPLGVAGLGTARTAARAAGMREEEITLEEGDVLLLYTDGLVERRDSDILTGLERLRAAGEEALPDERSPDASRVLLDLALERLIGDGGSGDDVCALSIHRRSGTPSRATVAARSAPALGVRAVLRPRASSVGEARDLARAALVSWGLEALVDRVTLIVSELVTNAVTHAGTPTVLELSLVERTLRVSAADQSINRPQLRDVGPGEEHGRGVLLVSALSDRWGAAEQVNGKQVWAEIDLA